MNPPPNEGAATGTGTGVGAATATAASGGDEAGYSHIVTANKDVELGVELAVAAAPGATPGLEGEGVEEYKSGDVGWDDGRAMASEKSTEKTPLKGEKAKGKRSSRIFGKFRKKKATSAG